MGPSAAGDPPRFWPAMMTPRSTQTLSVLEPALRRLAHQSDARRHRAAPLAVRPGHARVHDTAPRPAVAGQAARGCQRGDGRVGGGRPRSPGGRRERGDAARGERLPLCRTARLAPAGAARHRPVACAPGGRAARGARRRPGPPSPGGVAAAASLGPAARSPDLTRLCSHSRGSRPVLLRRLAVVPAVPPRPVVYDGVVVVGTEHCCWDTPPARPPHCADSRARAPSSRARRRWVRTRRRPV